MSTKQLFCLSGYGYLQDITLCRINGCVRTIARINVVTHYDMSNVKKDDIYIDCEISDGNQLTRLNHLIDFVRAGKEVLINFKAEYSFFMDAYSSIDPVDSNRIIILQAKLQTLNDCYVNGHLAKGNISYLRAVA